MLLKQPLNIGNLTVHNRLVLPPMASKNSDENGYVTDEMIAYYENICRGGFIGLAIIEHAYIHINGKAGPGQMSVAEDGVIEGLKRLVDTIHGCGSKVICQINHAGSGTNPDYTGGLMPVAPSPVGHPLRPNSVCRELTAEELKALPKLYADAALRVKAAGADGVEIHACHAYLLNQFYSPLTNFRTDEYGGTLENRVRMIREVYGAVREAVGDDYPIAVRLGGSDYMEGGSTIEDAAAACKLLAEDGVDLIDLSGGMNSFSVKGRNYAGYFRDMSEAVKAAVDVPVILTGGVREAAQAEYLLQKETADLIGVGRAILANHRWAEQQMGK
ncbi:MAG: NADH:flavin oxidoreductase [Oscillospiraceae bacterium]|nr:NADH:flavin oxidoreductase [Oscillospiraceae bacterium]